MVEGLSVSVSVVQLRESLWLILVRVPTDPALAPMIHEKFMSGAGSRPVLRGDLLGLLRVRRVNTVISTTSCP